MGPAKFSHFDPQGNPVGKRDPKAWVQLAAVKAEQTRNTATLFPVLISQRLIEATEMKPGNELWRAYGGRSRMELLTTSARSAEGNRPTFLLVNEAQWWTDRMNGPKEMFQVVKGNLQKLGNRYLAISNAFIPGEDSVLEDLRYIYEETLEHPELERVHKIMYDSIEPDNRTPLDPECLREILPVLYGDAVWLEKTTETTISEFCSPRADIRDLRRKFMNQVVADEDSLVPPSIWDPLTALERDLRPGDEIVLGFDGGKSEDATALIAIRLMDMCVFPLGVWEAPAGAERNTWEVDKLEVDSAVHQAFRMYRVHAFFADVALWESYIDQWQEQYGDMLSVESTGRHKIMFDMRKNQQALTAIHEQMLSHIFEGKLRHNGDLTLRRHVMNARRRDNNWGVSFGKESRDSKKKVDAYAAMMLAHAAALRVRAKGVSGKTRTARVYATRSW